MCKDNAEKPPTMPKVKELLVRVLDELLGKNPYPPEIFIEPTKKQYAKFQEILKGEGFCLDAFSGSVGRRLWKVIIKDIKDQALTLLAEKPLKSPAEPTIEKVMCGTCRNSRVVYHKPNCPTDITTEPCPDCAGQFAEFMEKKNE